MTDYLEKKKLTIQEKLNMSLDDIIIVEQTNEIIDLNAYLLKLKREKKNIKKKLLKSFQNDKKYGWWASEGTKLLDKLKLRIINLYSKGRCQEIEINNLKKKINILSNKYYKLQDTKIEYLDKSFKDCLSLENNEDWNVNVTFLQPVFHWEFKENNVEIVINSKLEKKKIKNKIYLDNMILVVTDKEELLILTNNNTMGNLFNGMDININTLNYWNIKNSGKKTFVEGIDKNDRKICTSKVIEFVPLTRYTLAISLDDSHPSKHLWMIFKLNY